MIGLEDLDLEGPPLREYDHESSEGILERRLDRISGVVEELKQDALSYATSYTAFGTVGGYGTRWPVYARQWDHMILRPAKAALFAHAAKRLVAAKPRYQAVDAKTGVPWWMIAVIHERESSQSWKASLAQGDRWDRVSTHVPRGRGPFSSWEAAAIDALHIDHLDHVIDYRLEKAAYYLEAYNGWGYRAHGVPSAYLWAGTSIYSRGKYVADGQWSFGAVDQQLGCMGLVKAMAELDPSIQFVRET